MNKETTSKEEILLIAKKQAEISGLSSLSMRTIASECHIALGTIYHYFCCKDQLLSSLMEEFWRLSFEPFMNKIKEMDDFKKAFKLFCDISKNTIEEFKKAYLSDEENFPSDLMEMSKEKETYYLSHIKDGFKMILSSDKKADLHVFTANFPLDDFITLLLNECVLTLRKGKDDFSYLNELIDFVMYRKE